MAWRVQGGRVMEPSIAGFLICGVLFACALFTEAPIIVALMASLAFGSTAIMTLSALGGSSPLIYVVFLVGLFATVALRRNMIGELGTVFARQPLASVVVLLILYTVAGALVLPRLFEGQTMTSFPCAPAGSGASPKSRSLPVTGNIAQSLYFVLTALSFFAFSVLLLQRRTLTAVQTGFFTSAGVRAGLGYIDLVWQGFSAGGVLEPVRSHHTRC